MSGLLSLGTECVCGDINPPGSRVCEGCDRPLGTVCVGCGAALPVQGSGRPRKWCGDSCRKGKALTEPEGLGVAPEERRQVATASGSVSAMQQWWLDNHTPEELRELGGWAA